MSRYLFGPVPGRLADADLTPLRDAGACRTFGPTEGADLRLLPGDT